MYIFILNYQVQYRAKKLRQSLGIEHDEETYVGIEVAKTSKSSLGHPHCRGCGFRNSDRRHPRECHVNIVICSLLTCPIVLTIIKTIQICQK